MRRSILNVGSIGYDSPTSENGRLGRYGRLGTSRLSATEPPEKYRLTLIQGREKTAPLRRAGRLSPAFDPPFDGRAGPRTLYGRSGVTLWE